MAANHGSNPAAWAAVVLALAAFTVGGIGLMIGPSWPTFWVGVGLLPLALLVGRVMAAAGFGSESS